MNKYLFLTSVFLLTGCPGPGDRMMPREYTTAIIKDNQVCVISPLQPNERITAVEINSNKSSILRKLFADNPIYVPKGECLPLFNITPQPGLKYFFYWDVISQKGVVRLVETRVSVTVDNSGNLQIE